MAEAAATAETAAAEAAETAAAEAEAEDEKAARRRRLLGSRGERPSGPQHAGCSTPGGGQPDGGECVCRTMW